MSILVFLRHARHSSVSKQHPGHCIVGQIQDGRYLFKVKPLIYIIFDRIEADSWFWYLS